MGGAIGLESRDGVGSTFWFSLVLPRVPTGERSSDRPVAAALPRPVEDDTSRQAHLLLVEDGAINREIAR